MDDKCIMEGLLLDAKSVCDLYMHGAIESSSANVRRTFSAAFDDALSMGETIRHPARLLPLVRPTFCGSFSSGRKMWRAPGKTAYECPKLIQYSIFSPEKSILRPKR